MKSAILMLATIALFFSCKKKDKDVSNYTRLSQQQILDSIAFNYEEKYCVMVNGKPSNDTLIFHKDRSVTEFKAHDTAVYFPKITTVDTIAPGTGGTSYRQLYFYFYAPVDTAHYVDAGKTLFFILPKIVAAPVKFTMTGGKGTAKGVNSDIDIFFIRPSDL